jgi:hypothetical protein
MTEERIPSPVIGEVARALEAEHSHAEIDNLFMRAGANVGAADGVSKLRKIDRWLRKIDADPDVDALGVLGRLLEDFMERQPPPFLQYYENRSLEKAWHERRKRVRDAMAARGLSYQTGGRVRGGALHAPSKSLAALIRGSDLSALHAEFERALAGIERDPPAALTAACAILEAMCRTYIADEGLSLPADQSLHPLWKVVQGHLELSPAATHNADLKRILGGLASIVDGVGAFRTHASSAHGRDPGAPRIEPRHARLAVHAAHTVVTFVLERSKKS